jgi:hypothetical protein
VHDEARCDKCARFTRVKSVEICLGKANVDINAVEEERNNGHLRQSVMMRSRDREYDQGGIAVAGNEVDAEQ